MDSVKYSHLIKRADCKNYPFFMGYRKGETYSHCFNWHESLEVMIVIKGTGSLCYGTSLFEACEGDIFIINKEVIHRVYSPIGIDICCIVIEDAFFHENEILIEDINFIEKTRDKEMWDICQRFARQYEASLHAPTPVSRAVLRKCGLELIIELCSKYVCQSTHKAETGSISEDYIRRAIRFIRENCTASPGVDEIAQHLKISRHHLEREFKKYTNQTITHYANTVKCKKAAAYLMDGMSVTETASECGFNSISYFSRTFTKVMGYSPSKLVH